MTATEAAQAVNAATTEHYRAIFWKDILAQTEASKGIVMRGLRAAVAAGLLTKVRAFNHEVGGWMNAWRVL